MNRRDLLAAGAIGAAATAAGVSAAKADYLAEGVRDGHISIDEARAMIGAAPAKKDVFVITTPGPMDQKHIDGVAKKAREAIGPDVPILVMSDGLMMFRV